MTRLILRAFGRAQRSVAWTILVGGLVMLVAVVADIVRTGDAKWATILASVLVINDGYAAVQQVENELGSEAAAED